MSNELKNPNYSSLITHCSLVLVLLLAMWLGARGLNADAIWGDERNSIYDAGGAFYGPRSPVDVWARVAERNPWHAPGYFLALNAWGRVVGWEPFSLRALSLLAGLLAVAWTYRLGADIVSLRVGLYGAAVLGTSAFFVHYLHELRMYTLFVWLAPMTVWGYFTIVSPPLTPPQRAGEGKKGRGFLAWGALFVGAVGLLYTHYFAALPLVATGIYHLLFAPKNRRWWLVVGVFALAALTFAPWMRVLVDGLRRASESNELHARALGMTEALGGMLYLFANGVPLLAVGVLGFALPPNPSPSGRGARLLWFFALATIALILLVNTVVQVMHGGRLRYWMAVWAFLALLAGVGMVQIEAIVQSVGRARRALPLERRIGVLLLGVWMALGVYQSVAVNFTTGLDGSDNVFPLHQSAAALKTRAHPGDLIVNYLPDTGPSTSKYEATSSFYYSPLDVEYVNVQTPADSAQAAAVHDTLLDLIGARARVWVVSMSDAPPAALPDFEAALDADYDMCVTLDDRPTVRLTLYTRQPSDCES